MSGCGSINFWGFSPSFDMLKTDLTSGHVRNVLIMGAGDLRHVFAMFARIFKNNDSECFEPVHVYILESRLEVYARQILQLYLLSRNNSDLSLNEKVELFLEIHGNLLLRPATKDFIQQCGSELVKLITDLTQMSSVVPFIDLSLLKYKELDYLESIFKFWRGDKRKPINLDAKLYWDLRLRQFLGQRYDSKKGSFDWDYNMRLCDRNCKAFKSISPGDYCRWRSSGVAFELREADYMEPNRTLITPAVLTDRVGEKTVRYGYWGDIVNSPYLSFVLDTESYDTKPEEPEKSSPGERHYASSVAAGVSQRLLSQIAYTMATGNSEYNPENVTDLEDVNDGLIANRLAKSLRIHFLPVTAITDLPRKSNFHQLFDVTFVSVSLFHMLNECFVNSTMRVGSLIVAETGRHLVELNKEQAKKLNQVITEKIQSFAGRLITNTDAAGDEEQFRSFLVFNYEPPVKCTEAAEESAQKTAENDVEATTNMLITQSILESSSPNEH